MNASVKYYCYGVHTKTPTWEIIGDDNGLTWVYTNTPTWELIGKDDGLTWVNTNTPTWERICTVGLH